MSKFTEMMLHAEEEQALIAEWLPDRKQAVADWRAMREAWEAMVVACGNAVLCWGSMDYDESPFRRETIAELRAALAKARK